MSQSTNIDQLMSVFQAEDARSNPQPAVTVDDGDFAGGQPPRSRLRSFGRLAWNLVSWAGVIAAAVAVIAIAGLILVPRVMGWQGMIVLSGSMEPALETGGLAFVDKLSPGEMAGIAVGDVITFENPRSESLVSHRVVEIFSDDAGLAFVTKGDANNDIDGSPVRASRVVGKVRFDVPYVGNAVQRLQNRMTYYIFLGIPAALLIASEAWNIVKEVRRNGSDKRRARSGQGVAS